MNVTPAGFATMIRMLMDTGVPVAAILEGGYFLEALAADSEWVVRAMLGEQIPRIQPEKIHPMIAETIVRIQKRYQKTSEFFSKALELRDLIHGSDDVTPSESLQTDYKGERIVQPPYETRGIYTPFTEEKVDGFRRELDRILKTYKKTQENVHFACLDFVETHEDDDYIGVKNGKIQIGNNARIFADFLFLAPTDTNFVARPIQENNGFNKIRLDDSLRDLESISAFESLPIF